MSIDIYSDALPQSTGKTCQSYAAALALAGKSDSQFPINSFVDLRQTEQEFRAYAESHGNPLSHIVWDQAMLDLTNGKYTFQRDYPTSDLVDWLAIVRGYTSIDSEIDILVSRMSGGPIDMVLTSVYDIAGSNYSTGHIVSVMGFIGSGLNSNTELVAFNSAIKGGPTATIMCNENTEPGDFRYKAGVLNTNDFRLKGFDQNFLIMRLVEA